MTIDLCTNFNFECNQLKNLTILENFLKEKGILNWKKQRGNLFGACLPCLDRVCSYDAQQRYVYIACASRVKFMWFK